MFIIQFPILTLNKRSLQGGLLNFLNIFRPARVPGKTNVPHFSLMETIKVEKKMNRSLSSVLTLMASLSSRNITLFVPCFVSGVMIQRILLPQVDLDVLIYHRFVLRAHIFVASSINAICPNVLKTKTECHILAKD